MKLRNGFVNNPDVLIISCRLLVQKVDMLRYRPSNNISPIHAILHEEDCELFVRIRIRNGNKLPLSSGAPTVIISAFL